MKKFICKVALLAMAFAVLNTVLLLVRPKDKNAYLCEYNKKVRLLETTPQPRMIFIGGSNIAFGIDSKKIGDALNYNVVNFGLHAGIGIRYPVEDVLQYIQKGDVVVLQFEYENFFNGGNGEPEAFLSLMISTNWRNIDKLNMGQWKNVISQVPSTSFHTIERFFQKTSHGSWDTPVKSATFVYLASGFNKYGDEVSHFDYPNKKYKPAGKKKQEDVKAGFIDWLDNEIRRYEQAGAKVVMLPPVCIKSHFLQVYDERINEALTEILHPYIVPPSSMVLDDSYMFDTEYHMNREGCNLNTQNIIRSLYYQISAL